MAGHVSNESAPDLRTEQENPPSGEARTKLGRFAPGHSGNKGGRPAKLAALREKAAKLAEQMLDDFIANGVGTGQPGDAAAAAKVLQVAMNYSGAMSGDAQARLLISLLALKERVQLSPEETRMALNAIAGKETENEHGTETTEPGTDADAAGREDLDPSRRGRESDVRPESEGETGRADGAPDREDPGERKEEP